MFQFTPLILALALSAAISGALGAYAWRHRWQQRGVYWFAIMMFAACLWAVASGLRWSSTSLSAQFFWQRVGYPGISSLPVLWLLFVTDYTRRGRFLTRAQIALLWVVPGLTWILAWTNPWHHWMWSAVVTDPAQSAGIVLLRYDNGPWFLVYLAYSYVLLLVSAFLLISALLRSPERYRGQAGGLVVGLLAPWVANVLFQFNVVTTDPTPLAFAITGVAFAWAIFRHRMLNIVSVAHDAVIRSLRDPVIVLDVRRRVVDVNPAAAQLLGCPADEVVGELGETALSGWSEVAAELKQPNDREIEVDLSSNGALHPYRLRLSTLLDRSGYPSGRLLHFQDIEKHKQTEAALHETEESFYAVVEGMKGDAYFEVDRSGLIRYANRAFCEGLGYAKDEVIGAHFGTFIAPESEESLRRYFRAAYAGGGDERPLEYLFRRRDGSLGVGEVSISLVQMKDANPVGARGIVRDVTERKRAEGALQRAKEAAEEASQAKSRFLTNISHELRTPLTSVLGYAKVMQKKLAEQILPHVDMHDPKTERAVRQVTDNLGIVVAESLHLTTLINDVLDVARIESGQVDWQRRPVAVAEVVQRAVTAARPASVAKDLRMSAEIEPDLPDVLGDSERLTQALGNLLSNAVKFTAAGGTITCAARRAGDEIVISVTDTGIGIAAADRTKVFEPFVQIGDTLTGKPPGTGLGLPICKQIVEQHGGRLAMESEVERGSTFSIALPIAPP
jgi:PAS domain S-box-containing protein